MNINEMIIESVNKIEAEGLVQKMLDEQIKQTLSKAVSNLFGNYSDFSKSLENQLKETLKVDLSNISLECHTQFILNKIEESINLHYKNDATAKVQERLKSIFRPLEKTQWKLSEIMEKFEETVIEGDEEYRGCEFTFIPEDSNGSLAGYRHVFFDKDPGKSKYSCDYRFGITDKGELFTLNIEQTDMKKATQIPTDGFDHFLYQLLSVGATIDFDYDDVSSSFNDGL